MKWFSRPMIVSPVFAALVAASVFCLVARAADDAAEVQLQRALDAPIDLSLDKVELSRAFDAIAAAGKLALSVDAACYEALPYGATTKVSATFRGTSVRAAINEVLTPLGLEQAVSGNSLVIRPSRALLFIGRKAEWEELKLLQKIRTQDLPKIDVDWTADLRNLLGQPNLIVQMEALDPAAQEKAMAQVRAVLPCSVAQALDTYAAATNQIWTVQGESVIVLPMKKWIARQLERPIVVNFNIAPLGDVIAEISRLSRIHFQPEPGLYLAVPKVSLQSKDGTVQMTLDYLSGVTGIAYEIKDDGIFLHIPGKPGTVSTTGTDSIIGRVGVPLGKDNLTFDLFLRESDLSPELNELRKKKMQEAVESLAKAWKQPATSASPAVTAGQKSATLPAK